MSKDDSNSPIGRFFTDVNHRTSSILPKDFKLIPWLSRVPNQIRRKVRDHEGSSFLTMFPVMAVLVSLVFTVSLLPHSGVLDCREGFDNPSYCREEPALNVNGDLEVYLPTDPDPLSVKNLIAQVEEDWTTNVMVIYVESYDYNVTCVECGSNGQINILEQIDNVERAINYARNDKGEEDDVIYVLSISTVIKEVNSSGGRVVKAFFSGLAEATGNQQLSDEINETIDSQSDLIGNYAIPEEQQRVNQILQEMPQNALDKLVRNI